MDYSAFGESRGASGAGTTTPFGFTGEQTDPTTGLVNLRARQYAPGLGRFLSRDTVVPNAPGTQGFNPYAYAANNPTSWTDPSGHAVGPRNVALTGNLGRQDPNVTLRDFGCGALGGLVGVFMCLIAAFLWMAWVLECHNIGFGECASPAAVIGELTKVWKSGRELRGAPRSYPMVEALPRVGGLPECVDLPSTGTGTMAMMPGYLSCESEVIGRLMHVSAPPRPRARTGPFVTEAPPSAAPTPDLSTPTADPTVAPTSPPVEPIAPPVSTEQPVRQQECRTAGTQPYGVNWPHITARHAPDAVRGRGNGIFNDQFWANRELMIAMALSGASRVVYQANKACRFEIDLWDQIGEDLRRNPAHSFAAVLNMTSRIVGSA